MSYFISDIKKMYKSRLVQVQLVILMVLMLWPVIDILYTTTGPTQISLSPFVCWFLIAHHASNTTFHTLYWAFPLLSTGMLFFYEERSSVKDLLVIRKGWRSYYLSKAAVTFVTTFVNFFVAFTVNFLLVYAVLFRFISKVDEQLLYRFPKEGMFSYPVFEHSQIAYIFFYIFLNSLAMALYAMLVFAFHAIVKLKNQYVVMVSSVLGLYVLHYLNALNTSNVMNLDVILQPLSASALTSIIETEDVISIFRLFILIVLTLIVVGYLRNRESV